MDKRLLKISEKVENGIGLADIGTDHGYLPVYLALHGYTGQLYASDINAGPLETARLHAAAYHLEDRIEFLLCDGLSLCPPDKIDTIVIAGMGGDMMCHILAAAEWVCNNRIKLILQPMTKQEVIRSWLCDNGFRLLSEDLVREGRLYQIITARYSGEKTLISAAERYCGKYNLVKLCPEFPLYLDRVISRFEAISDGQKKGSTHITGESPDVVLEQLREMRAKYNENK